MSPAAAEQPEPRLAAVVYARVSTKDQAERDGEADGNSIPAQREACTRKAGSLGADVAAAFVDRGESACSADRPELQHMLAYLAGNPTDFVIVHKVDRLAATGVTTSASRRRLPPPAPA